MSCDEARLGIYALLDDELDIERSLDVLAHLERCPGCLTVCQEDQRLRDLVQHHLSPYPAAPPALWAGIRARLDQETLARSDRQSRGERVLGALLDITGAAWRSRPAWAATAAALSLSLALTLGPALPPPGFVADEILADHVTSLARPGGPIDFPSSDPHVLMARFRHAASIPDRAGLLRRGDVQLLGGSFCRLRSTRGIRFTYSVGSTRTASLYLLERPAAAGVPSRPVYVGYLNESPTTGAVVWTTERALYAFVADLPRAALQQFAQSVAGD